MFDSLLKIVEQIIDAGTSLMGQDQFFNLVVTVVGMGWLWLQRKLHIDRTTDRKWDDALLYIEAGVMQTYQTYVKARKAASEDGTLTEEEKKTARQQAWQVAAQYAAKDGINLLNEVGDLAGVLIEKAVGGLKQQCSGPTPLIAPPAAPATPVVQSPPSK
jgi:hypothetical protein